MVDDMMDRNTPEDTAPAGTGAGGGPVTPGRAGQGMGVSGEERADPPSPIGGGPETTVTVGVGTGQRRDPPDRYAAPPTPKDEAGKRPRNREEGKPG